jgi:translocator protein
VQVLAYLIYLVGLVCSIIILIHAFKASVGQGLLCLCIPFYVLYYAFARFEHPKKNLILAVWLGSFIIGGGLYAMTIGSALSGLQ